MDPNTNPNPVPTPTPPAVDSPVVPAQPLTTPPMPSPPSKFTSKRLILVAALVFTLALIAVGSIFLLKKSSLSSNQPTGSKTAPVANAATDQETKTKIALIYRDLEVYFAENGYYPTADQVKDIQWAITIDKGVKTSDLADHSGKLMNSGGDFKYEPGPAGCKVGECMTYTLTAQLSDGTSYTKYGTNN